MAPQQSVKTNASVTLLPKQVFKIVENTLGRTEGTIQKKPAFPNTITIVPSKNMTPDMVENLRTKIFKNLNYHYPNSNFYISKEVSNKKNYKVILANSNKNISIKIFAGIKKEVTPEVLRAGMAFELYVESGIKEQISLLKDLRAEFGAPLIPLAFFNLTLNLSDGIKNISISNITDAKKVGQAGNKEDILITRRLVNGSPRPSVKISLKQTNFSFWSSANAYSPALNVLQNTINSNIVNVTTANSGTSYFSGGVKGIYVPATPEEVKKFCFGEGENQVDYIVIGSHFQGMDENYIMHMNCKKIYRRISQTDFNELCQDVYLLISEDLSKNSSALLPNYRGFDVRFANKAKVKDAKNKYVQGVR